MGTSRSDEVPMPDPESSKTAMALSTEEKTDSIQSSDSHKDQLEPQLVHDVNNAVAPPSQSSPTPIQNEEYNTITEPPQIVSETPQYTAEQEAKEISKNQESEKEESEAKEDRNVKEVNVEEEKQAISKEEEKAKEAKEAKEEIERQMEKDVKMEIREEKEGGGKPIPDKGSVEKRPEVKEPQKANIISSKKDKKEKKRSLKKKKSTALKSEYEDIRPSERRSSMSEEQGPSSPSASGERRLSAGEEKKLVEKASPVEEASGKEKTQESKGKHKAKIRKEQLKRLMAANTATKFNPYSTSDTISRSCY